MVVYLNTERKPPARTDGGMEVFVLERKAIFSLVLAYIFENSHLVYNPIIFLSACRKEMSPTINPVNI